MEVFDGYGAKVTINNLTNGEESPSGYFTLLHSLGVDGNGGVVELGVALASRDQYSGHEKLARERYGSVMTAQLSDKFPYDKVELRSWADWAGVSSAIRLKGFRGSDVDFSPDQTRWMLTRVGAVAIGGCLGIHIQDLDPVMFFSPDELRGL